MMMARPTPTPLWFAAALIPMVGSQIVRLQQSDPAAWIVWDYAGRLGVLAVLCAIPAARKIAFRFEPLRIARWEVTIWIVGIVLVDHYWGGWIRRTINGALPATVLGAYPEVQGWLHVLDIFFGLGLVALSEEILFRRCAHHLLKSYLDDGYALVLATSCMFGAFHWWTGFGNIGGAVVTGGLLMTLYRRSGALCTAVFGHYLADVVNFAP